MVVQKRTLLIDRHVLAAAPAPIPPAQDGRGAFTQEGRVDVTDGGGIQTQSFGDLR